MTIFPEFLNWIVLCLGISEGPYLHELLEGSEVHLPQLEAPERVSSQSEYWNF